MACLRLQMQNDTFAIRFWLPIALDVEGFRRNGGSSVADSNNIYSSKRGCSGSSKEYIEELSVGKFQARDEEEESH
jgi:hypothetical protein